MTTALDRARARLDTPPTTPIPGQLDLRSHHMDTDPDLIVEGFHGPGGWAEGRRILGLRTRAVGMERDAAASITAKAAGHTVVQCDVATMPTAPMRGRVVGKVDSAPCQPWTKGGHRLGLLDQPLVHQAVEDLARGRDTRARVLTACKDPRSLLAAEPMRWHYDLRPEWIALEEVPAVLPLFQQYAAILRAWGYSVWVGILNAADYGLGQTRRRAILIASRVRNVTAPAPTHTEHPADDLFGERLLPWVTMADALGWGYTQRPAPTITGGGTDTGGAEPWSSTSRKAMRAAMDNPGHWAHHKPAPTVTGTVGHVGGKQAGGHLNLTVEEGAVLQGFRATYPFHGNKGQRSLQVGNAIPPLLAAHVLSAATGVPMPAATDLAAA
ncbi:DNA cytosine methyltransferase [Streptomyces sp. MBT60]|uniref:DNA cytosine methyltransferase n=1 Tax=Streptomyces sp. MBT60 TaxID=2800409 RepID=UPI0027DE85B4|nr:DNA cytosine methyltransferase [Streptomyces sp. MBT60]